MAGVFGKDPHMGKSKHSELERANLERKRKLAQAATQFRQKNAAAPRAADAENMTVATVARK
jgi:hypothetical protein